VSAIVSAIRLVGEVMVNENSVGVSSGFSQNGMFVRPKISLAMPWS
jgi:hypothetical protein